MKKPTPKRGKSKAPSSTTALDWALAYIKLGWPVLPLWSVDKDLRCQCKQPDCSEKNTGKHPVSDLAPHGCKSATTDEATVRKWFTSTDHNVGIATGQRSGFTVVDVDMGPGKVGFATWQALNNDHGEPDSLMAHTGGGGMHVLLKYNVAIPSKNNFLGEHIDVKNDNGYIVACPSRHRSGGVYAWANWEAPIAEWPAWFVPVGKTETRGRPRKDDLRRKTYTLEEVKSMLSVIPADDRDLWLNVGMILGREFDQRDEAWALYEEWAGTWGGKKERNHDKTMREMFYVKSKAATENPVTLGTIIKLAIANGWVPKTGAVPKEDLVFVTTGNNYLYRHTDVYWVAAAVDAAVSPVNVGGKIVKASDWLKVHRLITSLACDPLVEEYVREANYLNGVLVPAAGAAVFNMYRRATIELGEAKLAKPWVDHVRSVLNKKGDDDQCFNYLAHRVQFPGVKPRFALLLAGEQGTGKDTVVEMCIPAIGAWNVKSIEPAALDSAFNEYAAATLVRISETSNLADMSKWAFNERTKVLIAGNPDDCTINPKYGQKFSCRMFCGVIMTTNNLASGIFIPPDDRRYDVMECATLAEMGLTEEKTRRTYFEGLWTWFYDGGAAHIAAWLHERDLTAYKDGVQRKTEAHRMVIQANRMSNHWLLDILDELGSPNQVRADWIINRAEDYGEKTADVKRKLAATMRDCGYTWLRNPDNKEGRWSISKRHRTVYVKVGTEMVLDLKALGQDDSPPPPSGDSPKDSTWSKTLRARDFWWKDGT